jgi:hypothetical protein
VSYIFFSTHGTITTVHPVEYIFGVGYGNFFSLLDIQEDGALYTIQMLQYKIGLTAVIIAWKSAIPHLGEGNSSR